MSDEQHEYPLPSAAPEPPWTWDDVTAPHGDLTHLGGDMTAEESRAHERFLREREAERRRQWEPRTYAKPGDDITVGGHRVVDP